MDETTLALSLIAGEARSLLSRLDRILPFALHMTMVGAARGSAQAEQAIQTHLDRQIEVMRALLQEFLDDLGAAVAPSVAQRRLAFLKLRYNQVLAHFDIYSDVLVQRSEHEHGVFIAGLDAVAGDGLRIPGYNGAAPPVLCYLDRGHGAAIRRARTRLPGGGENPVALIRVPRERMVGSGVGSSLLHEVGHQAAALLDLVTPLKLILRMRAQDRPESPWSYFARWISEVIADFWSVLMLGVTSTVGLIGVVSLPAPFVFRTGWEDPHPFPWMRVQISSAIGETLYPDPQWAAVSAAWGRLYPLENQPPATQDLIEELMEAVPEFVELLAGFRPSALAGPALAELAAPSRRPAALRRLPVAADAEDQLATLSPTHALAAIGQARFEGRMTASRESALLRKLLTTWALRRAGQPPAPCPQEEFEMTGATQ